MLLNWKNKFALAVLALSLAGTAVQPVLGLSSAARTAWCWGVLGAGLGYYARRAATANTDRGDAAALFAAAAAIGCIWICGDSFFKTSWFKTEARRRASSDYSAN